MNRPSSGSVDENQTMNTPDDQLEELSDQVQPLPTPTFTEDQVSRAAATLSAALPSFQADVAVRALDQASRLPADRTTAADETTLYALVAYGVGWQTQVRDLVIAQAATTPERTKTMLQVFRGAPAESRPSCAVAAATAMYASSYPSAQVRAVLDHAGRFDRLAVRLRASVDAHLSPVPLGQGFDDVRPRLAQADRQWQDGRATAPTVGPRTGPAPASARRAQRAEQRRHPPASAQPAPRR